MNRFSSKTEKILRTKFKILKNKLQKLKSSNIQHLYDT